MEVLQNDFLGIPIGIILWSFIGNLLRIIYQFSSDRTIKNLFQWIMTRSILSIIVGAIIYLGILYLFVPRDFTIMYLIVFLVGISDLGYIIIQELQKIIVSSLEGPLDEDQAKREGDKENLD